MRRWLSVALVCLLALPLLGCGQKGDPSPRRDLHKQVKPPPAAPAAGEEPHG